MNATVRKALGIARWVVPFVVLPLVAMVLALLVTPPVSVSAFGQTVQVGAVTPSLTLGLSGPGQADLFGEGTLDTVQHFNGPIRPKIVWQRFNRNDAASSFLQSSSENGRRTVATGSREVGAALASGWSRYFWRLFLVAALIGGALYLLGVGAVALLAGHDHQHRSRRYHFGLLGLSIALSLVVTAVFTALTVVSATHQLGKVTSLSDLVGTAKLAPVPITVGVKRTDVDVVVIGDSTAAGIGNTPIAKPSRTDRICHRSADSYANALGSLTGLTMLDLACSSATISAGLLGPQQAGTATLPPQVGLLQNVPSASVVVVSIGANDVGWSDFLRYCYGLARCDDQASESLFLSRLDSFKVQYTQLLQQLSDLPTHPTIVVNEYYDPFGDTFDCPDLTDPKAHAGAPRGYGFAADPGADNQDEKIAQKVDPLESELQRMNDVIEQGAQAFGFIAVSPPFEGHELCTDQSWVQGLSDPAPFHPNSAGELAIAAADLRYLRDAQSPT